MVLDRLPNFTLNEFLDHYAQIMIDQNSIYCEQLHYQSVLTQYEESLVEQEQAPHLLVNESNEKNTLQLSLVQASLGDEMPD